MTQRSLHRGLELRLEALADRIEAIRQRMKTAKGADKIEAFGEIEELKRRRAALTEQLQALDREGPGFRQNIKAELETMVDDLSRSIEDFVMDLDASSFARQGRAMPTKDKR